LHEILPETVELLSVTNVKSDKIRPKLEINEIRVLYALNQRLLPAIKQKLVEPLKFIERRGRMIAKITYKFDEHNKNNSLSLSVSVKHNNIYLKIGGPIELFSIENVEKDVWQCIVDKGKTEVFNQVAAQFLSLEKKYPQIKLANTTRSGLFVKNNFVLLEQNFQIVAEQAEYVYADEIIDEISNFVIDYMILLYKITGLNWQIM